MSINNTVLAVSQLVEGTDNITLDIKNSLVDILAGLKNSQTTVHAMSDAIRLAASRYDVAEMNIVGENNFDMVKQLGLGVDAHVDVADNGTRKKKSAWDVIGDLAEILGLSALETGSLFLDLVQLLGAGILEAGTGWIDGYDWEAWLFEYIPHHVNDSTLLAVLTLLSWDNVAEQESLEHYQQNLIGWETYLNNHPNDYYIEDQNGMEGLLYYGNHSADYNACEVIALYNALLDIHGGDPGVTFPELLQDFEGNGIVLGGEFGTNPVAIYEYLNGSGYDVDMLHGMSITTGNLNDMQDDYSSYILTAYNNQDSVEGMIHTISITTVEHDGNTYYVIHNAGDSTEYESLAAAVNGYNGGQGEPITVIGVN